jgi:hypothetical protein
LLRVRRIAPIALGLAAVVVACGRGDTGAHVFVRLGPLEYDELRFGVTRAATGESVVDPATAGRYAGPFRPGDQDVIIYLSDDLDGSRLHCEVSALRAGQVAGFGAGDVTIARGMIRDVEIFMATPVAPDPPGMPDQPPPDPPDMPGTPGRANGEACSVGMECATGHCVDGVCCESDCRAACRSCALGDSKGLCRPVPGGTPDPRGVCEDRGAASCQGNGLCDVAGDCAVYPAGTICEPARCSGNGDEAIPARTCNGQGKCEDHEKTKCPRDMTCLEGVCA